MRVRRRGAILIAALIVLGLGSLYIGRELFRREPPLTGSSVEAREPSATKWAEPLGKPKAKRVPAAERDELLTRAQIWRAPAVPIERVSFAEVAVDPKQVRCRFRVTELSGTTPKFDCNLPNGELVRIKYGKTGEVPAEVATTRLLRALGFAADRVEYVRELRCYGCPEEPFSVMKAVEITQAEAIYSRLMLSYDDYETFEWVAIERRFDGKEVRTDKVEGWSMFELDRVDAAKGGAPRAHIDALRLLAVFLAHWDNKSENQRLVCLSQDDWSEGERCSQPFLLLQDVGSTFGPAKVNLEAWEKTPIWDDRATCATSMRELPFNGATFGQVHISEEGRRFLAGMLTKLSDRQLDDLFTTARFDDSLGLFRRSTAVSEWVRVFKERVRMIAEGPSCPPTT